MTDEMFDVLRENLSRQANPSIETTTVKTELVPKMEKVEHDDMGVAMNLKRPHSENEPMSGLKKFKPEPIDNSTSFPAEAIYKIPRKRLMVDPKNVVYVANKKKHFATLASPASSPAVEMQEAQKEPEFTEAPKRRAWKRYKPVDKVPAKKRKVEKEKYPYNGPVKLSRPSKKFRYEPYKKKKPKVVRNLWKRVDNKFVVKKSESDSEDDVGTDTGSEPSKDAKHKIKKEPFIKREIDEEIEPIAKNEFPVKKEVKREIDDPYFNRPSSVARRGLKRKYEEDENEHSYSPSPKRRRTLRGSGPAPPAGSRIYCRMWKI
ncbi:hypothetical protein CAEBREN_28034 [Caenorhabditis brenneri]|uniref:Uncharacterized protein n=1 Tax=Caenorhabditis brenneri TaxID=135651 RepID=G0MVU1_CAEBE|nr:hypothetical protein CAEBREN_28034 [Caenorhabditis brenneri]